MQEQAGRKPMDVLLEPPSWEQFFAEYIHKNRPVVIRNLAREQAAFDKWTDEYLAQGWPKRKIQAELNKSETRGAGSVEMAFPKFLKEIYRPERSGQLYGIIDFDADRKAKADLSLPTPIRCKEVLPQSVTLWMSSGGTSSVLHADDAENLLMQVAGRKSAMLVHQDEAQNMYAKIAEAAGSSPVHQDAVDLVMFPKFADLSWYHAEMTPGDVLYIPHTYWHQVNSFERNLAVNLWWQHEEDWRWWNPTDTKEYRSSHFGGKGFMPFDKLKARGPESQNCTPIDSDKSLNEVKFMDEGAFKKYAAKRRKKAMKHGEL